MERQKKVLDASVIIKTFCKEQDSEKALDFINEHLSEKILIVVPSFMFLEILNSLKYKKYTLEQLKEAKQNLSNLQLKVVELNREILDLTIFFSTRYNLTIYDSVYVALAQLNECELITADKELFKVPNVVALEKV